MLDADAIAFLRRPEGAALLAEAAALPGDVLRRLTALRRRHAPARAAAAVELLELRRRAEAKFERAAQMFFTPEGLEQSSGGRVARWRAARFPSGATILDLCCGIGGDTLALSERGPVLAFDRDPVAAACARANAAALGAEERVAVACADVTTLRLAGDAAFFDPSRRRAGRRVAAAGQYGPPLAFLETVQARVPNLAVKVSPALEDAVLNSFGGRVEFISDRGECKEAVLWFGGIGPAAPGSASVLPAGASLLEDRGIGRPDVACAPRAWLYEPDAAVVRAHLIAETAALLGADLLDPRIAYLTADTCVHTPFATAYRVLDWLPFSARRVRERLRALGRRVTAIKRRGVPLEPEALARQLAGAGDAPAVVVLTRLRGAPAAILCEPPGKP